MPRKPKALAEISESDQRWADLKTWINAQLSSYSAPRVSDILLQGKRLGLKPKQTRALLQANVPEYRETTSKIYQSQKRSRVYNTRALGYLACDIAFFGKIKPELRRIGKPDPTAGCLVARDILSRYVYAVVLKDGKSAESIKNAFLELFAMHERERNYPIRKILFDGEKAVSSLTVKTMLQNQKPPIQLHVYSYSRVKSAMAEGLISHLRSTFQRFRLHLNEKNWHQILPIVTDAMNAQKLIINDKTMSFSPKEIQINTLGKFLSELERLNPAYLFSHFTVDPTMIDFKYEPGTYVALKEKAISSDALEKRSEIAVDAEEWVIVHQTAYFSQNMAIVPCYTIESLVDGQQIVAPEDSLVEIVPSTQQINTGEVH